MGHSPAPSGSPAPGVSLAGEGSDLSSLPALRPNAGTRTFSPARGFAEGFVGRISPKQASAYLSLMVSQEEAGSQDYLCHWLPI